MDVPRVAARTADHRRALADRLRALGIPVRAGRRAALTDLASHLPAAVLADAIACTPRPP